MKQLRLRQNETGELRKCGPGESASLVLDEHEARHLLALLSKHVKPYVPELTVRMMFAPGATWATPEQFEEMSDTEVIDFMWEDITSACEDGHWEVIRP